MEIQIIFFTTIIILMLLLHIAAKGPIYEKSWISRTITPNRWIIRTNSSSYQIIMILIEIKQ